MAVPAQIVKELRERTGISLQECKKALEEADGNIEKALALLSARATTIAQKKSDRVLGAVAVEAYVHNNTVGALISLSCETDFVAKNEEFIRLARDIAMHVTAMQPENVKALLQQAYIKDESKTIRDLLSAATQKFGERIEISAMATSFNTHA